MFEDVRIPLLGDAMANGLCRLGKSGRSQMGSLAGFSIAATGIGLPEQQVTNEDLAALGCDSEWIVQRTGIHQRRKAADHQSSGDLAYEAAVDCLKRAGVTPGQVDLVVVATLTPDHATPSTACLLQARLGCIAPAFDLNAACSGFLYALVVAGHMVSSGFSR
ncbi:MAG: ketoacyl-ACP synthase III, partial [Pirellulaceae bacterium]